MASIPVGPCSGSRLATMLVATITIIIFPLLLNVQYDKSIAKQNMSSAQYYVQNIVALGVWGQRNLQAFPWVGEHETLQPK